ncbi:hypothetical protein LguiB_010667 [Lonicera macranthoides]
MTSIQLAFKHCTDEPHLHTHQPHVAEEKEGATLRSIIKYVKDYGLHSQYSPDLQTPQRGAE